MRRFGLHLFLWGIALPLFAQENITPTLTFKKPEHEFLSWAFGLAVKTVDMNIKDSLLKAGAGYGGEWTRDASMNAWNGASLLRPKIAAYSLWSVTLDRDTIGHQYWDKIIWTIGAWNHYLVTGDKAFLNQAYRCVKNTFAELERDEFDNTYGLFKGPSHINDGIAAYPVPLFDSTNQSSFVLDHPRTREIKAFSTNLLYFESYKCAAQMADALNQSADASNSYRSKAEALRTAIIKQFYLPEKKRFGFLVLPDGTKDTSQEGFGVSYALLFDVCDIPTSKVLIANTAVMPYGITNVYPNLPRYSDEKPGRHNNIVWPVINGYWGEACAKFGDIKKFQFEFENMAHLALDSHRGNGNFKEIYHAFTGVPHGGWQSGKLWDSEDHQTWSATAYLRLVFNALFGMRFEQNGIRFTPSLPKGYGDVSLKNIPYRQMTLDITLKESPSQKQRKHFLIDGKPANDFFIPSTLTGNHRVVIFNP
jgi:hypothetical protein